MGGKVDHIGLVEIMIVFYRVVDDDREEDDGAADQAVDKGIGDLTQPGFLVEGIVGTEQGIEEQPAYGDGGGDQPEAGGRVAPPRSGRSAEAGDPQRSARRAGDGG